MHLPILCGSEPPGWGLGDMLDFYSWGGFDALMSTVLSAPCRPWVDARKAEFKSQGWCRLGQGQQGDLKATTLDLLEDGEPELSGNWFLKKECHPGKSPRQS